MSIRFVVGERGPESVAIAYSPLFEAVVSLHVLSDPRHHPVQHRFVRRAAALPPALRREIRTFAFAVARLWPGFALPADSGGFPTFEEEVAAARRLPVEAVAADLLRPLHSDGPVGPGESAWYGTEEGRRAVVRNARPYGRSAGDAVQLLLDEPAAGVERFLTLLTDYWEATFAAEWERIEPELAAAVAEAGTEIARSGVLALVGRLSPRLRVEHEAGTFGLDTVHEHRIELTPERRLTLVPSVFAWPHVGVNCDPPWPLTLVYPAPSVAREGRPTLPPDDLLRVLRAVADPNRLKALRLLAERPRSTQELAPLVGLSEQGLSKHLRILADAGVATTHREGYYVLYSVAPERLASISDALLDFLEVPSGEA